MSDEDEQERVNRELIELLNELRVALPGVQVLFAFLLTVPFTQRFETLSDGQAAVYFSAVLLTAVASILFIAPSAHHRLRFRQGFKEQLVRTANALAIAGTVALAAAIGMVVYLIADVVYGSVLARISATAISLLAAGLWFVLPLVSYRKGADDRSAR